MQSYKLNVFIKDARSITSLWLWVEIKLFLVLSNVMMVMTLNIMDVIGVNMSVKMDILNVLKGFIMMYWP